MTLSSTTLQSLMLSHLVGSCLLELFSFIELREVQADEESFSYTFSSVNPLDEKLLSALEEKLQSKIWQEPSIDYSEMMRENLANLFAYKKQLFKKQQAMQATYNIVGIIKIGEYVDLFPSFSQPPVFRVKHFQFTDFLNLTPRETSSYVYCLKGVQAEDKLNWKKNLKRAKEKKRSHHLKLGERQQLLFRSSTQQLLFLPKGHSVTHRLERTLNHHLKEAYYEPIELPRTCCEELHSLLKSRRQMFKEAQAFLMPKDVARFYEKSYQEPEGYSLRHYPAIDAKVKIGGVVGKDLSSGQEALALLKLCKAYCEDLGFYKFFLKDLLVDKLLDCSSEDTAHLLEKIPENFYLQWGVEDRFERQHAMLYLKAEKNALMWAWVFSPFALLALMLEEHKGLFPLCFSPEVFRFLPQSKAFQNEALYLQKTFQNQGIPCGVDVSSQALPSRYKQALLENVLLPIEVGQKEREGVFKLKNFSFCPYKELSLKQLLALGKKILDTKVFLSENLLLNIDEAQ